LSFTLSTRRALSLTVRWKNRSVASPGVASRTVRLIEEVVLGQPAAEPHRHLAFAAVGPARVDDHQVGASCPLEREAAGVKLSFRVRGRPALRRSGSAVQAHDDRLAAAVQGRSAK
jgi:hypothetical protein